MSGEIPQEKPALPEKRVLTAAEVAAMLGLKESHFRATRDRLEAEGFPQKLPGRAAWSRAAVIRWIDTDAGRSAA